MDDEAINWTKFAQGPVSDDMWTAFKELVYQSHIYAKHKGAAREARRMALVRDPSSLKSAKRQQQESKEAARSHDSTWHGAEFLAHTALNQMARLGDASGSDHPDWRFSIATIKAVGSLSEQTKCNFSVTAINSIDVGRFLEIPSRPITEHLRKLGDTRAADQMVVGDHPHFTP